MFQPPLSIGSRLARRATTLPHSITCRSMFMPMRCSTSVATCGEDRRNCRSGEHDDELAFVSGSRQVFFDLVEILGPARDLDPNGARHWRAGNEEPDIGLD